MARKKRNGLDAADAAGDPDTPDPGWPGDEAAHEPSFDLVAADPPPEPPPPPPPTAIVVPAASLAPLEDRVRRLEDSLGRLQTLDGLEQRLADRLQSIQRDPPAAAPPAAPPAPGVLDAARALVSVGRTLLPTDPGPARPAGAPRPSGPSREWLLQNVIAELQAVYFMYVDPRYQMSWLGRLLPPALLLAFLFSGWWLTLTTCGLGTLVNKPIDLALCYALFKVVAYEARRYRETAPDLPPHLRL